MRADCFNIGKTIKELRKAKNISRVHYRARLWNHENKMRGCTMILVIGRAEKIIK